MSELTLKAQWFAMGAHGEQKRKYTGDPYWFHLDSVVKILMQNTSVTDEMLAAAWLHDVVEDTTFRIFDISIFFGKTIAELVNALTEPSHAAGNRAQRKAIYNEQLANACPTVQTIKYADLIDNTSSIVERDPDFAKLYLEEKRILLPMIDKGCPKLYEIACRQAGLK